MKVVDIQALFNLDYTANIIFFLTQQTHIISWRLTRGIADGKHHSRGTCHVD